MKNLFLVTLLISFSFCYAQISFEKGYYINDSGKKTDCFIKNIDWRDNPTDFEYKDQLDSQSKTESIANVQEFGIDNFSKYKRFKVKMERSSNNLNFNYILKSKNPIWREETHFLKLLVDGDATLYTFSGENITRYFYETKSTPIEQLVYYTYMNDDVLKEENQFRQQLYTNVRCANTPDSDIEKIMYRKDALIKHFTKYNSCGSNTVVNYEAKVIRKSFSLKITPSINVASFSLSDPNSYYNQSTDMNGKAIFKIGIEGEYTLPFNKNTWSLFINPTYQKYEVEKSYVKNDGFGAIGNDVTHTIKVNYSSIEIPVGIRHYFFINKNSKIFVNAAVVFDLAAGNSDIQLSYTNSSNQTSYRTLDVYTRNNMSFGVGYNFNRFSIELRLNTARQIIDYNQWSAKYNTTGIILGYKIL